ncbi:MAG TPA: hypothetical protein VIO58_05725 [Candidatus Methanoperedens sp.]
MGFHIPTLQLLKASILVAISGAFRVHIAFLFLGAEPNFSVYIAGGLIIYTIYTLDRTLESKEDEINKIELAGSKKNVVLVVSFIAFITGSLILFMKKLYIVPILPLLIGYLYSKGIKIRGMNLKLKGGLGVKNTVVALTWGVSITGIAASKTANMASLFFIFFLPIRFS